MACAAEELVCLLMLVRDQRVQWIKSQPDHAKGLAVTIGTVAASGSVDVTLVASVGPSAVLTTPARLTGTWRRFEPSPRTIRTGSFECLAVVDGTRHVEIGIVVLARTDIKMGRNRLWHVRREIAPVVPEPWKGVLGYGRTGLVDLPGMTTGAMADGTPRPSRR